MSANNQQSAVRRPRAKVTAEDRDMDEQMMDDGFPEMPEVRPVTLLPSCRSMPWVRSACASPPRRRTPASIVDSAVAAGCRLRACLGSAASRVAEVAFRACAGVPVASLTVGR